MNDERASDAEVRAWLKTLGVASLCQWDVLFFLYRHPTSLLSAEYIARLLGYADGPVVAALEVLESLGLVEWSRFSQNVRLYQFITPFDRPRGEAFERLRVLADHRPGRVLLAKQLRRPDQSLQEALAMARPGLDERLPVVRAVAERSRESEQRSTSWLKAI
jgi:DNA-binding MarR family transcriptional regulator